MVGDNMATTCERCEHCVALGQGDFACFEDEEPVVVIVNHERTNNYCYCCLL